MIDSNYYEKLGGFSCVLSELRTRLGEQQTDILVINGVQTHNFDVDDKQRLKKSNRR